MRASSPLFNPSSDFGLTHLAVVHSAHTHYYPCRRPFSTYFGYSPSSTFTLTFTRPFSDSGLTHSTSVGPGVDVALSFMCLDDMVGTFTSDMGEDLKQR